MTVERQLYSGNGTTIGERGVSWPDLVDRTSLTDPAGYVADPALTDEVNVALTLQQPLLVTGEPGTGKTQLASSVAHELGLPPPLVFHTKSASTVRDLFYSYDSLRHFHDAQFRSEPQSVEGYVEYACLGLAILLGMDPDESDSFLPESLRGLGPTRSVVLIDEIDKAPRDVPNDMLNEIEEMSFTVKETGRRFVADAAFRPILVITSNSEKTLPDAFLRRCVYCHISFPDRTRLGEIARRRLRTNGVFTEEMVDRAIEHFQEIRSLKLRKPPATAELLEWLTILRRHQIDVKNPKPGDRELIGLTYCVLAKSREDLMLMKDRLGE